MPFFCRHLPRPIRPFRLRVWLRKCSGAFWLLSIGAQVQAAVSIVSTSLDAYKYTTLGFGTGCLGGYSYGSTEAGIFVGKKYSFCGLIENQDAVALPFIARQFAPVISPPLADAIVQPPVYRRDVSSCTPTLIDSKAVAAGRGLNLNTLSCQIRFNLSPD